MERELTRGCIIILFISLFCCVNSSVYAQTDNKELVDYPDMIIKDKQRLTEEKEEKINNLKSLLKVPQLTLDQEYNINEKLYNEYKAFQLDSAISYTVGNRNN